MDDYIFKTYRCEWLCEVYEVDQYGMRSGETLYEKPFPNRELANYHREQIADPHKWVKGRWVWKEATHQYHEVEVRYREVQFSVEKGS